MDPIKKIPKKFTKKSGNKVINRQYFCRKTGLESEKYLLKTQVQARKGFFSTHDISRRNFFYWSSLNALTQVLRLLEKYWYFCRK